MKSTLLKFICFLIVGGGALCGKAYTQELGNNPYIQFKQQLALPDSATQSRVTIHEEAKLTPILSKPAQQAPKTIGIHRIRIFFDNSQNARGLAEGILARFREMYPDIPASLTHENPYFKVTVGRCLTHEEALIIWGRIKDTFDRAFVVREQVPLSSMIGSGTPAISQ